LLLLSQYLFSSKFELNNIFLTISGNFLENT